MRKDPERVKQARAYLYLCVMYEEQPFLDDKLLPEPNCDHFKQLLAKWKGKNIYPLTKQATKYWLRKLSCICVRCGVNMSLGNNVNCAVCASDARKYILEYVQDRRQKMLLDKSVSEGSNDARCPRKNKPGRKALERHPWRLDPASRRI